MRKFFSFICLALFFLIFLNCKQSSTFSFHGNSMGTYYNIVYIGKEDVLLQNSVDSLLYLFSNKFSIFDTSTTISQINRGENVLLDEDFIYLFSLSQKISEETDGAFDITIGPLVELWGFGRNKEIDVTQKEIDSVRSFVGFNKIRINDRKLVRDSDNMTLNFNAIAKGYAVDKIAHFMENKGYKDFIVEIGGEVVTKGTKNRKNWKVGIQIPTNDKNDAIESYKTMEIKDKAVATSGNYRNYHEQNGVRYSHIINPKTGYSQTSNLLSVTVIADNCATADAYATAFMVMGTEKAMEFLQAKKELAAFFIYINNNNEWETAMTKNFPILIK